MAVTGVDIEGRMYEHSTHLPFFETDRGEKQKDKEPCSWSTVLGRNGAGKSTISTALWDYTQPRIEETENSEQSLPSDNLKVTLNPDNGVKKERIYVFNEDFIRNKLRFDSDELGAVLMLKEQEDIKVKIDAAKEKEDKAERKADCLRYETGKFNDKTELPENKDVIDLSKVVEKQVKNLENNFRGDNNWAGICKEINNQRHNKSVSLSSINEMYLKHRSQLIDEDELGLKQEEFDNRLKNFRLLQRKSGIRLARIQGPDRAWFENLIDKTANSLRTQPVAEQEGADRLVNLLQSDSSTVDINSTKAFLSHQPAPEYCDKCLQQIDSAWRDKVLEAIAQIQARNEIRDLQSELEAALSSINDVANTVKSVQIPSDLPEPDNNTHFSQAQKDLMDDLKTLGESIKKKITSPYTAVNFGSTGSIERNGEVNTEGIKSHFGAFASSIETVNESIDSYNNKLEQLAEEQRALTEAVTILELSKNFTLWDNYTKLRDSLKDKEKELGEVEQVITSIRNNIASLESKLNQFSIAMDKINEALQLVFLSPNRMQLKASQNDEDAYSIYVRDTHIPLRNLSTGEKNAIAIAYFFSMPYEGKPEHSKFDESMLFVLDDPITSLDRSNEIGIFSLIEREFTTLKKSLAGATLQVLLLTHSYQVFYAMQHVSESVFGKKKIISWILSDCELKHVNSNKPAYTYRSLIEDAYDFARLGQNERAKEGIRDHEIPNELRRALEEYSWFNFGVGGTGLRKQPLVKSKLKELVDLHQLSEENNKLILGALNNFWLNSGSHREENAKSDLINLDLLDYYDTDEVKKVAKLLLILLDEIHFTGLPGLLWGPDVNIDNNKYKDCQNNLQQWRRDFSREMATSQSSPTDSSSTQVVFTES